jgi:hypothetical protein
MLARARRSIKAKKESNCQGFPLKRVIWRCKPHRCRPVKAEQVSAIRISDEVCRVKFKYIPYALHNCDRSPPVILGQKFCNSVLVGPDWGSNEIDWQHAAPTLTAMGRALMPIVSRLMAAIRSGGKPKPAVAAASATQSAYAIPTVMFDPKRVTEEVEADLKNNIKKIEGFDESHFDQIYAAALQSVSRGRDLAILFNAIMALKLPDMTKQRTSEISLSLNNKATALMNRNQQVSLGIEYATWIYSGAPCQINPKRPSAEDIRQDAAHKAANGKRYEVITGMFVNGRLTMPGRDEGCKCSSRSIIPGFE